MCPQTRHFAADVERECPTRGGSDRTTSVDTDKHVAKIHPRFFVGFARVMREKPSQTPIPEEAHSAAGHKPRPLSHLMQGLMVLL
jgi:hypothetical protein